MSDRMIGDDLEAARRFTDMCQTHIFALLSDEKTTRDETSTKLKEIRTSARQMSARSIARMAETALNDIKGQSHEPKHYQGSLLSLNKLIFQYAQGLDEVYHVKIAKTVTRKSAVTDKSPAEYRLDFMKACDVLRPLLKFTATEAEKQSLEKIADIRLQSDNGTQTTTLDTLMPAITNELLRYTRRRGKALSISHGYEDLRIDKELGAQLSTIIVELCQALIDQSLETQKVRHQADKSGAGHMAFTANRNPQGFDLFITCEGHAVNSHTLLSTISSHWLGDMGANVNVDFDNGISKLIIKDLPLSLTILDRAHQKAELRA